jgi:hypothetical protein
MKQFIMRSNYAEKLLEAARQHPTTPYDLQVYAEDLDVAVEHYVLDQRQHHFDTMLKAIASAREIYARVCQRPLLAD